MKKLYINLKTFVKNEHLDKPRENRKKINKIENKPQQVEMTMPNCFFDKANKMDESLTNLIKEKREQNYIRLEITKERKQRYRRD